MANIYIIFYTWGNTANNHAGMAYLVKRLKDLSPNKIKLIEIPQNFDIWNRRLKKVYFNLLAIFFKVVLKRDTKVLFMEYFGNISGNQTDLAIKLRHWGVTNPFFGFVHLAGDHLIELYGNNDYLKKGLECLDRVLVLGSSLADFLSKYCSNKKIVKTFHYVDTSYYCPSIEIKPLKLQVIHLGSLKRNFLFLKEIIELCPNVDFHVCQGKLNLYNIFKDLPNVKLYGFLSESELLKLMQSSHLSLNILDDTVGSNVITTSLACGLPLIVSDVGSIRDYCDPSNSILCRSKQEFVDAISHFDLHPALIKSMSESAISKSKELDIKVFNSFLLDLLCEDNISKEQFNSIDKIN